MGSFHSKQTLAHEAILCDKQFNELFDLSTEIGCGSYASVSKCIRKSDSMEFAVKTIQKNFLTKKELIGLKNEIKILKQISHKNVIKLIDVFDDGNRVSLVLELCDGKDLFDTIISSQTTSLTECKAAQIVYKLSNALQYLHENGVIHRDLKPENILFTMNGTIKISDFGLAHSTLSSIDTFDSRLTNTFCGSPYYLAPEVIKHAFYDYKCDIWSLGVILYIMLAGHQPFRTKHLEDIYDLIIDGKYNFKSQPWNDISEDAKDLVKGLLNIDPNKRYSIKDIKCHPWIIKHTNKWRQWRSFLHQIANGVTGILRIKKKKCLFMALECISDEFSSNVD